ncbi:MAG: COP23 domain-containing protein [Cyanobacteria bacterium P01_F01_bin.42]
MSRNITASRSSTAQILKLASLSGCLASLMLPILPTASGFAMDQGEVEASEIESTAPGASSDLPSDSQVDDTPVLEPGASEVITRDDVRFACLNRGGEYTVMYQPESRPGEGFPWAVPRAMGGGWSAESRCSEIARRLEEYRPDGLVELKTGNENGYSTLCATTEENQDCRIVLTVPPNQDPVATRNAVFDNLLVADTGEQTTGVATFAGGAGDGMVGDLINLGSGLFRRRGTKTSDRGAVKLKPFLDRADGGSARALRNGVRIQRSNQSNDGLRLNPERFR